MDHSRFSNGAPTSDGVDAPPHSERLQRRLQGGAPAKGRRAARAQGPARATDTC